MPRRSKSDLSRLSKSARAKRRLRERERKSKLTLNIMARHISPAAINVKSEFPGNNQTLYPAEETQMCFDFQENMCILPASMIKKEIIDPFEQNEKIVSPDHPLYKSPVDFIKALETEVIESSKTDHRHMFPRIKVEHLDNEDEPFDEEDETSDEDEPSDDDYQPSDEDESSDDEDVSSKTQKAFESVDSILASKYKLTECSVLLYDCLTPKNFAWILSHFKSLKINKTVLKGYLSRDLYPSNESPFFSHCDVYRKIMPKEKGCLPGFHKGFSDWINKKLKKKSEALSKKVNLEKRPRHKVQVCHCNKTLTIGRGLDEYSFSSAQQLCSCFSGDNLLLKNPLEEISSLDPDFGKITCGINNI